MCPVALSAALLATCAGEIVKIFNVEQDSGDPCTVSYSPSPGSQVNSVKWNHTNLVVASAGDDNKISLWNKNGRSMGTMPLPGSEISDDIEESITSINFSNKSSRYLCSGGSGHMIRIWDLQRKRCIKWLSGHTDTITGVMYNCKDEHLASISIKGDLILYNLASGARVAELKDPNEQALRVLDYSRPSRHILATAGDDGSVHLWDTTGRSPKVSWLKSHSAPTTGLCFSPSSDKIIASVGLDKKLYTFDSGTKRPTFSTSHEAPFSSLAYSDDGNFLAAGTNNGRIVFYDIRGKPEPFTVLRAYNTSEAVTSICWQRAKPVIVNENNCTTEMVILGGSCEDSVLMPDPLPSVSSSSFPSATIGLSSRSSLTVINSGPISTTSHLSAADETPNYGRVRPGGSLSKLQAPHLSYNFKDDMNVFSPLADVQPITPSLGNWYDEPDESKEDSALMDKKSAIFPSSIRRFPFTEGISNPHPIMDWRSSSSSRQDDTPTVSQLTATPVSSSNSDSSFSATPPEAWGGNALSDKLTHQCRSTSTLPRFQPYVSSSTGSIFSGSQDPSASFNHPAKNTLTNSSFNSTILQDQVNENSSDFRSGFNSSSVSTSFGTKAIVSSDNTELPGSLSSSLPRRYSTYAERISTASSFSDVTGSTIGSPKSKKTGAETREELVSSFISRQGTSATTGTGSIPAINGVPSQPQRPIGQTTDPQQGASFSLQLFQRTLEETLESVQESIHRDVRNLHVELIRQFHLQEVEVSRTMSAVLEKQDELMKEVQSLRKENQQLRQLLNS